MILWIRFFFSSVCLMALLRTALLLWGMEFPWLTAEYGQYAHIWLNRAKFLDLALHIGGICLLIAYGCWFYWRRLRQESEQAECEQTAEHPVWLVLTTFLATSLVFWTPSKPYDIADKGVFAGLFFIWVILTILPFYQSAISRFLFSIDWSRQWSSTNTIRVHQCLVGLAIVQLFFILKPFVIGPVQLLNEYPDIPSITILYEANKEVDDKTYYDEQALLGAAKRYSPDRDRGHTPPIVAATCFSFEPASGFSSFMSKEGNGVTFIYDKNTKQLCAVGSVTPEQWLDLRQLTTTSSALQSIDAWFVSVREFERKLQEKILSRENKQFYRANQFVMGFQLSGMGVLHHHNFLLGPLNEYDLGKPQSEIFAQYGWMNLWMTRHFMKLLGGIDYQNYFRVWYSYYYLYYLLYLGLLWIIFRRSGYVAAGMMMAVGLLGFIDFQWILQAPGLNPVRRIMELPLIIGLFWYWQSFRRRYLMLVILSLWLGILNNWQFGLMMLGAFSFSMGWYRWSHRQAFKRIDDMFIIAGLAGCVALLAWMKGNPDPLSKYYLAGGAAYPAGEWLGLTVLIAFCLGAALLLRTFKSTQTSSFLCLFLLLYTSEIMTYSIWNATPSYLLVPGPLYALVILVFVQHLNEALHWNEIRWSDVANGLLISLAIVIFLLGSRHQDASKTEFSGVFGSHKNYQWNMERAKFESSMNPRYFQDSVDLIQKYSTDPGIYIVSKYDNFIPFLAHRYSAMPFFEINKFLASPREMEICVERLKQDQPAILFVDTDIKRNFATDIVHQNAPLGSLHAVSRYHVEQMRNLQKVFFAVQDEYELVEQGLLISVYRRK